MNIPENKIVMFKNFCTLVTEMRKLVLSILHCYLTSCNTCKTSSGNNFFSFISRTHSARKL